MCSLFQQCRQKDENFAVTDFNLIINTTVDIEEQLVDIFVGLVTLQRHFVICLINFFGSRAYRWYFETVYWMPN